MPFCPECGVSTESSAKFCGNCGMRLELAPVHGKSKQQKPANANHRLWKAFSTFDANHDGYLTADEIVDILVRPGGGAPYEIHCAIHINKNILKYI